MKKKITAHRDSQVASHPRNSVAMFHLSPDRWEPCLVLSFITVKKSSSQDHRCIRCVIESMDFLWTWQLKWVDSSLLLGSIPSPYGEPNVFLEENSWTQCRIGGWQVSREGGRIMFVKENQGSREISLLFSFFWNSATITSHAPLL